MDMKKEKELIKEIEVHIRGMKAGDYCRLELSDQDLRCIHAALLGDITKKSSVVAGDVVTDNGYHGEVVITRIDRTGRFQGYYVADGVTVSGLQIDKFTKIADRSGEWKACRGGVYFQKNEMASAAGK